MHQSRSAGLWKLARWQHGVVARHQLFELGYSVKAIEHRIAKGRLHPIWRGVYAVGRPTLTQRGRWMAAVMSCGSRAVLSHKSAAALWGIRASRGSRIDVSVLGVTVRRRPGVTLHRRTSLGPAEVTECEAIPVTAPVCTLIDLATVLSKGQLEAAINEADKHDLADPDELRSALDAMKPRHGVGILRALLDKATFTLTESELERLFLPIAHRAGLGRPRTQVRLHGFRADFLWPELKLIVETDGLRYHRTPAQQARDRDRDQVLIAAGFTVLRFTHAQVRYEPQRIEARLADVAGRLSRQRWPPGAALTPR
jgi:very-short-patch-repair endonuclease